MASPASKLTSAVEDYLADLRSIRATGGATGELSYHTPLNNLLAAVGATLKPKVRCVGELKDLGAGRPDLGLYAARQVQRGRPREGQLPECGVVEVKPVGDDAWLTADSAQVSRYWNTYRLVLVTNTRDFVLLGEDAAGKPTRLETFRLASTQDEFESRLETPHAFDVYLNDRAYWRNVPAAVWHYKLGGYQVLKKWLSYREHKVLARPLHPHEVQHFTNTARRITAILMLTADS